MDLSEKLWMNHCFVCTGLWCCPSSSIVRSKSFSSFFLKPAFFLLAAPHKQKVWAEDRWTFFFSATKSFLFFLAFISQSLGFSKNFSLLMQTWGKNLKSWVIKLKFWDSDSEIKLKLKMIFQWHRVGRLCSELVLIAWDDFIRDMCYCWNRTGPSVEKI